MPYDVSIIIPAIRVPLWKNMVESIKTSCAKHTWELVLISPFDLPEELKDEPNIKLIKDFGCPSRCVQLGLQYCEGRLVLHCVDDALFLPNSIDVAIEQYDAMCSEKDIINCRYREGANFSGQTLPMGFWNAHFHDELRLPGIPKDYKIALHQLIEREYLLELGGFDCRYEYINHGSHDLVFRIQANDGKVFDSVVDVTSCSHFIGTTGDHKSIHDAQTFHDKPLFDAIYSQQGNPAQNRIEIEYSNWEMCPSVWKRRFDKGVPENYEKLLEGNVSYD